MRQRLSAVMAADIVDYTRLMGADQKATLQALQAFRAEVLRPQISAHRGDLIKDMGDGWLAEFASAADAVGCALAVQESLSGHPDLKIRLGINVGDVVREAEDIFGDGVNVAARLQAIAPAGGIALSDAAHSVLDGTLAPAFSDAGLHELKNVARPVHVWMRAPGSDAGADAGAVGALARSLTRLTIQPISVTSGDTALNDLAGALNSDILRLLRSSDWIAPHVSVSDGGADYVLSAVLRARGDQLRLEVSLKTGPGDKVWEGAFDGAMSGSFAWQDKVSLEVASNVFGAIADSERGRLFDKPDAELSAQECLECAVLEFFEISDDTLAQALGYVERAVARQPDLAPAYLQGVRCVLSAVAVGYRHGVRDWLPVLPDWLEKAERETEALIRSKLYRTIWTYMTRRDPAHLLAGVEEALGQAPFDLDVLCLGGWAHVWLGQPLPAIACFRKFEGLGHFHPLSMATRAGLATALVQSRRDGEAVGQATSILRRTREFAVPFRALASACAHLGQMAEARDAVTEALRLVPGDTLGALTERTGFADADANRYFLDGLRKAGFPEG